MVYINSNSTSPYFNFALEEYLMTEKGFGDDEIFLFWRTNPTVMIGRYQNTYCEINEKYVKENNINVVRRNSGGGTIYTDMGAWQFTFIEKNHKENGISFGKFTEPIVNALRQENIDAHFNSRNDLLIGNKKFSGNAQYRKDETMLHHGSILFNTDIKAMVESITVAEDKIIAKGIKSVRERVINISEVMDKNITSENFRDIMLKSLLKDSKVYTLTDEDVETVNKIKEEKFESWDWNYGKNPVFNINRWKRFDGGRVDFKLDIKKGIIKNCVIEGDFFLSGDISNVENAFIDCKYVRDDICKLLEELNIDTYFYKITKEDLLECIID
ncbi:lipoate--protein ligase [Terrisporobacter vanillatitrophus]|uniref:lipoate--protein ligase n=1 Tax=Terrisporobacter vanillatitrophus TaxID=3058402 RepID=UPI003368162B